MKKAVIFGIGKNFERRIQHYKDNYDIVGFVDNNKIGQIIECCTNSVCGGAVVAPCEINHFNYDVVIITPSYYKGIKEQLINMGVKEDKIVIDVFDAFADKNSAAKTIFGMKSYSQHGEDLIIAAIFLRIGIKQPTYIDLGANSPFLNSNTALMYENGCRGINVDASPDCIELFKLHRPKDVNLNVGVAKERGSLPFYMTSELSGRNSFRKESFDNCNKKVDVATIPVVTLDDIVSKYCQQTFPDYLDCDIEGYDFEVLNSYDLKKNGPKVICVECGFDNFDGMLNEQGYFKYCRLGVNNIYVRDEYKTVLWE